MNVKPYFLYDSFILFLVGVFCFATPSHAFGEEGASRESPPAQEENIFPHPTSDGKEKIVSKNAAREDVPVQLVGGREARRVPVLPFVEDIVFPVKLAYGQTIELELPEEVRAKGGLAGMDERLVSGDYVKNKVYLKGIAYAVGEATNLHVNTQSNRTLHLAIEIVTPDKSDHAFKFLTPQVNVFSDSVVAKEVQVEKEKLEKEVKKREENLEKVAEEVSEEKFREKVLNEEKVAGKERAKERDLILENLRVSTLGPRTYVAFTLKNRSKHDFKISSVLLLKRLPDPKRARKTLGFESIEVETPSFERERVPAKGETKALLTVETSSIHPNDQFLLKVIEEDGLHRVVEFKRIKLSGEASDAK